jgi:hypothetical protein
MHPLYVGTAATTVELRRFPPYLEMDLLMAYPRQPTRPRLVRALRARANNRSQAGAHVPRGQTRNTTHAKHCRGFNPLAENNHRRRQPRRHYRPQSRPGKRSARRYPRLVYHLPPFHDLRVKVLCKFVRAAPSGWKPIAESLRIASGYCSA